MKPEELKKEFEETVKLVRGSSYAANDVTAVEKLAVQLMIVKHLSAIEDRLSGIESSLDYINTEIANWRRQ